MIYYNQFFQITGYEEIQPNELDATKPDRLYSVIYMLKGGEMVCTQALGANIQYPGATFVGMESNTDARIAMKVADNTDHTMTRRFFGQWLRFEQIATKFGTEFKNRHMPTQTSLTSDEGISDGSDASDVTSESESVVPNRRVADSEPNYAAN